MIIKALQHKSDLDPSTTRREFALECHSYSLRKRRIDSWLQYEEFVQKEVGNGGISSTIYGARPKDIPFELLDIMATPSFDRIQQVQLVVLGGVVYIVNDKGTTVDTLRLGPVAKSDVVISRQEPSLEVVVHEPHILMPQERAAIVIRNASVDQPVPIDHDYALMGGQCLSFIGTPQADERWSTIVELIKQGRLAVLKDRHQELRSVHNGTAFYVNKLRDSANQVDLLLENTTTDFIDLTSTLSIPPGHKASFWHIGSPKGKAYWFGSHPLWEKVNHYLEEEKLIILKGKRYCVPQHNALPSIEVLPSGSPIKGSESNHPLVIQNYLDRRKSVAGFKIPPGGYLVVRGWVRRHPKWKNIRNAINGQKVVLCTKFDKTTRSNLGIDTTAWKIIEDSPPNNKEVCRVLSKSKFVLTPADKESKDLLLHRDGEKIKLEPNHLFCWKGPLTDTNFMRDLYDLYLKEGHLRVVKDSTNLFHPYSFHHGAKTS